MATGDITIRTTATPDYTFNIQSAPGDGAIVKFLKPEITIEGPNGIQAHYAPYGSPGGSYFWILAIAILLLIFIPVFRR